MYRDTPVGATSAVGSAIDAAQPNPRNSNTGVVITNSAENTSTPAVVDWMSFTVPVDEDTTTEATAADYARRLGDCSQVLDRGALGYTHGWRLPGAGVVLHNPARPDMGVHVSLPSEALQFIPYEPRDLIAMVLTEGGRFTRVDVAVDTHEVHISTVDEAIQRGDLVSRATNQEKIQSYKGDGFTIYIGSRTSDRFTRIYNKQAEQGLPAEDDIWTRAEVEFKGGQAQTAACHILQGVDLRSLVFSAIDFRDRAADSNTSRCPRLDWWEQWIGAVDRVSFAIVQTITDSVERAYEWVRKQCAPTLAFLDNFFGKDPTWLYSMCDANEHRISGERRLLLDAA